MNVKEIYVALLNHYGFQRWKPGKKKDEVIIASILKQNSRWESVQQATRNLINSGALTLESVSEIPVDLLVELIEDAGYHHAKAALLIETSNKILNKPKKKVRDSFREYLLTVNGLSKTTVDMMLLFAFNQPTIVIDNDIKRLFVRMGILTGTESYDQIQRVFSLDINKEFYTQFYTLLTHHIKFHCGKKPKCESCFLNNKCEKNI